MSDNSDYNSLDNLLNEYFERIQSSRDKNPNSNKLFLDVKEKLHIVHDGQKKVAIYEEFLPYKFVDFWKERLFDKLLEEYITIFEQRLEDSTDYQILVNIEIKSLAIDNLDNCSLSGDTELDGKKLGYLIAINGDNPILMNLVHNVTKYEFQSDFIHPLQKNSDVFEQEYWNRLFTEYQKIFRKLHWVCVGFLNAKKVAYLKEVQSNLQNKIVGSLEKREKLTNKQQVLILHKLGILDLPVIQSLSIQNQGKLFARLFSRNEKNTEDYIRYRRGKKVDKKFSLELPEVENAVTDLLNELGIKNVSSL